jgi:hypothetical protein
MHMDKRFWFQLCGAIGGYLLLMATNPARASLRDGLRCLRRHAAIWGIPALLGLAYSVFQVGLRLFYWFMLPEGQRPIFQWGRAWFLTGDMRMQALKDSILPAVESVAGIFNIAVTTYPCSVVAAALLLVNWGGHHAVLNRALRRRFGGWGWLLYFGITLCALSAIAKPAAYVALRLLGQSGWATLLLQASVFIDWLSFLFEYLFGVCIQIYLILLAYVWVRGVHFTREHLLDFAIRRFGFVVRWALVVMTVSTLLMDLPRMLSMAAPLGGWLTTGAVLRYTDVVARPVLAALLLLFPAMQIILTFHGESLRAALLDQFKFLARNAWPVAWLVIVAALHFYLLSAFSALLAAGMGEGTAVFIVWRFVAPLVQAYIAGWMLASWVCLYKRSEHGEVLVQEWIKF